MFRDVKKYERAFPVTEMATRAHDVVAMSIKVNSVILNFPELIDSLPHPFSVMPCDIQVAALV